MNGEKECAQFGVRMPWVKDGAGGQQACCWRVWSGESEGERRERQAEAVESDEL